jgi:HprK-related kinase A
VLVSDLSLKDIAQRLKSDGLVLKIGPFAFRIASSIGAIAEGIVRLYADYPLVAEGEFVDYTVQIAGGTGIRRWVHRQAIFKFDGVEPFSSLPESHAFPLLEWAMNWCISTQAHQYLILHSAVIEREGCAVIMPAPPGSGKSTLCAGLVHRGWRLLSDELALISLGDASIAAFGRPISLKNESIEIIRDFADGAVFNRVTPDTSKGSVTHLRVPKDHLSRIEETASPRWVVFPKYVAAAAPMLASRSKANSMLELGRNSFNYVVLGRAGFDCLSQVVDASDCYDFQYSRLEDAVMVFDNLVKSRNA